MIKNMILTVASGVIVGERKKREKEVKRSSPSWKHLFSTTKKLCDHVQDPITEVKISS